MNFSFVVHEASAGIKACMQNNFAIINFSVRVKSAKKLCSIYVCTCTISKFGGTKFVWNVLRTFCKYIYCAVHEACARTLKHNIIASINFSV